MRIALIRHFCVEEPLPSGWRTSAELYDWQGRYNAARVIPAEVSLGSTSWDLCLSSDMERAAATARAVSTGPIEFTELLREAKFAQFGTSNLRLPVGLWKWILRLAWLTGRGVQRPCRDEFRARVRAVADELESRAGNILVVSHAGMMAYLSVELRRRGFLGPKLRIAKHAVPYFYEKVV